MSAATTIYAQPGSAPAAAIANQFASRLRASTGFPLLVSTSVSSPSDGIALLLSGAPGTVGAEGYQLDVTAAGITLRANQPTGLFNGVQTLRQLLPVTADATTVQTGPWPVPGGHMVDYPRFSHRGAMLDVARHFFTVAQIERYLDQIALYKINVLHMHLSDDQG
jgi:hexosaminidase